MQENNTLISIILPVYNGEEFLGLAIESCINQTYKNFELIIVNDNSTDGTLNIAEYYSQIDKRIKIINNVVNRKLPESLNIGHKQAKGDFITWTSDDNCLKPNSLESLLKTLIDNGVDIVFSNYDIIYESGEFKRVHIPGPVEHLIYNKQIGASFLYKRKVFQELDGYDVNLFLLEDYDFFLRASFKFKFFHLNENLYQYRISSFSLTYKIQNDLIFRESYKKGIELLFLRISNEFDWYDITIEILLKNCFGQPILISDYLNNKEIIKEDLLKLKKNGLDEEQIIYGLFIIIRDDLTNERVNYNLKTLVGIIRFEPKILFHKLFSKKTTLNYIKKCII
jgi:glycosyltransferase involved in cell wall biosynthesis